MKIITDSTADLTKDQYRKHDVDMVPLTISLGDKTWVDFYDIDPDEYYAMLKNTKAFPVTSQPSPQDFINAYKPYVEKGEPILSIQISSRLSGTYQSAVLARSSFPDAKIEVIDSLQASLGLGLIILLVAEKVEGGASFESVAAFARDLIRQQQTYFSVDSLDYLQRGGRIGKAQAFLGTLMKIKPLLKLTEGEIIPLEKVRTSERLLNRFVELVEKEASTASKLTLSVAESDNSELMDTLLTRLLKIPCLSLLHRCKLGGVIASHGGPGTLGITFVKDVI
jgi:DegV family protein with EDD domain